MLRKCFNGCVWLFSSFSQGGSRALILVIAGYVGWGAVNEGEVVSALSVVNILAAASVIHIVNRANLSSQGLNKHIIYFVFCFQFILSIVSGWYLSSDISFLTFFLSTSILYAGHTVLRQQFIVKKNIGCLFLIDSLLLLSISLASYNLDMYCFYAVFSIMFFVTILYLIDFGEGAPSPKFLAEFFSFLKVSFSNLSTTALPFILPLYISLFDVDKNLIKIVSFYAILFSFFAVVPRSIFNSIIGDLKYNDEENCAIYFRSYSAKVLVCYFCIVVVAPFILYSIVLKNMQGTQIYSDTIIIFICLFLQSFFGSLTFFAINVLNIVGEELSVLKSNLFLMLFLLLVGYLQYSFHLVNGESIAVFCYTAISFLYFFRCCYLIRKVKVI